MVVRRLGTVALFAASLVVGGCVTNSASIYIAGAVPIDTAACSYASSTAGTTAGSTVDVALGVTYGKGVMVGFVVQSLLRQRSFAIATDPSTVIVEEAEIELSDSGGAAIGGAYTVDVAGAIIPGSPDGTSPGSGVVAVPIIPASVLAGFAGITTSTTLVVKITLRGRTNGHIDVEGGQFTWLVTLLPSGSQGVICDPASVTSCCNPGQDEEFYCTNVSGCSTVQ